MTTMHMPTGPANSPEGILLRTMPLLFMALVLTTYDDDVWVFDAIRAGAAGYLLKDTPAPR